MEVEAGMSRTESDSLREGMPQAHSAQVKPQSAPRQGRGLSPERICGMPAAASGATLALAAPTANIGKPSEAMIARSDTHKASVRRNSQSSRNILIEECPLSRNYRVSRLTDTPPSQSSRAEGRDGAVQEPPQFSPDHGCELGVHGRPGLEDHGARHRETRTA